MRLIAVGRALGRGVLLVVGLALLVAITGAATFSYKVRQIVADTRPPLELGSPPFARLDSAKRLAVVLLSNDGTEITDALPPYELLAASGAFNTVTVAPDRRATPLTSALRLPVGVERLPAGLDMLPDYGFDEYERMVGRAPDLIVIPNMTFLTLEHERAILAWIRAHAGPQTMLLSICSGSRVLVATGLLDGHAATGQHQDLANLQQLYPAVRWQAGVRWVDDGPFITASTLTTGIDATLHAIDRLVGRAAAERAGHALGYRHLHRLDDATADYQPPAMPDLGMLLNAMFSWGQDDVGVLLYTGISETALAAQLDIAALNLMHSYTIAPERALIRSRFGMLLSPRYSYADALALDRAIVLNAPIDAYAAAAQAQWDQQRGQPRAEFLTSGTGADFAYDAVLADVARHVGSAVARSDARNFVYSVDPVTLAGPQWTARLIPLPLGMVLLGLALPGFARFARSKIAGNIGDGPNDGRVRRRGNTITSMP